MPCRTPVSLVLNVGVRNTALPLLQYDLEYAVLYITAMNILRSLRRTNQNSDTIR